jgi:hypothetical protein
VTPVVETFPILPGASALSRMAFVKSTLQRQKARRARELTALTKPLTHLLLETFHSVP